MKREEVKNKIPGITDEQLDWLMGENGRDVTAEKTKAASLQTQVNELTTQLKAFEGVDVNDLKGQITKLQGQLTDQAAGFAFDAALDGAIRDAKGRDVKAIRSMLDLEKLKSSTNRDSDIKTALDALVKDKAWAFDVGTHYPTVKLHSQRGTDRGVTIRYGKNLTDLTQEESCAEVYTGVYPYWVDSDGNVTQITGNPVVNVPDGQYNFVRVLTLDVSQDIKEQPTAAQLRQAALDYIAANKVGVPKVSLTLSFAQLEQTAEYADKALLERVCLCDTVHVQFAKLGVSADASCIKTVYDVLLERYDSVELGDVRSSLANTVADMGKTVQSTVNKTRSDLERAIDRATQLITGNLGGYVVLHSSTGADEPDEILVMDKPEIEKATKVWRWNLAGWGYSSSGYGGPYRLAATMDGAINADFITTGTMSANLIRGGVLQSTNGKFVSNLDTGVTTFNGGLVVNSDNFKIGSDGSVDITGKFTSTVSESKCVIDNAKIEMYRKTNDGNWHMGAFMSTWGSNNAVGRLVLYGPAASNPNNMIANVTMAGQYEGGAIAISDAGGNVKVQLGVDGAGNGYVLVNGRMIQ